MEEFGSGPLRGIRTPGCGGTAMNIPTAFAFAEQLG